MSRCRPFAVTQRRSWLSTGVTVLIVLFVLSILIAPLRSRTHACARRRCACNRPTTSRISPWRFTVFHDANKRLPFNGSDVGIDRIDEPRKAREHHDQREAGRFKFCRSSIRSCFSSIWTMLGWRACPRTCVRGEADQSWKTGRGRTDYSTTTTSTIPSKRPGPTRRTPTKARRYDPPAPPTPSSSVTATSTPRSTRRPPTSRSRPTSSSAAPTGTMCRRQRRRLPRRRSSGGRCRQCADDRQVGAVRSRKASWRWATPRYQCFRIR